MLSTAFETESGRKCIIICFKNAGRNNGNTTIHYPVMVSIRLRKGGWKTTASEIIKKTGLESKASRPLPDLAKHRCKSL